MSQLPLNQFASITLDENGDGTAQVGPQVLERWQPAIVSVNCVTVPPPFAACSVYAGSVVSPSTFVDSTDNGNNDSTDSIQGSTVYQGQFVFAVWQGGTPGDTATITVTGTRTTRYRSGS